MGKICFPDVCSLAHCCFWFRHQAKLRNDKVPSLSYDNISYCKIHAFTVFLVSTGYPVIEAIDNNPLIMSRKPRQLYFHT
jgi:hypothetical protein